MHFLIYTVLYWQSFSGLRFTAISFHCYRKRKTKATESLQSRSARSTVRTVGDYDIYETIDDLSRHGSRYSKTGGYSQGYTDAYSSVSVDNFVPRQKHKPSYDKTIPEDDYNRITLRTSHEIPQDPDYARLHSDTDSGVVDTFAILHTNSSEENEVDGIDNTANSTERSTNNSTEYERTRSSATQVGKIAEIKPPLKRKDSYEMPVLTTKPDEAVETVDSGYSKPFKLKREENKQNDAVGGGTETPEKRDIDRKTIDIVSSTGIANTIADGYEEVRPVSITENASSAKDDLNTPDHEKEIVIIDIPLPKRNGGDSDSDSD